MKQSDSVHDQVEHILQVKILSGIGWILSLVGVIFLLNQASCSPLTTSKAPPEEMITPTIPVEQIPVPNYTSTATPMPTKETYNWKGALLHLEVPLPENPEIATVYQLQSEQSANLERTQALAQQFGMDGEVYELPPESTDKSKNAFLVVDGNQQLKINSDLDFWYIPDYTRYLRQGTDFSTAQTISQADAARLIDEFLQSHGFSHSYRLEAGMLPGEFYAFPLTPEGFTIRTSFFNSVGFAFTMDADGILAVFAKILDDQPIGSYRIISPETALQRLVDHNTIYGVHLYTNSGNSPVQTWQRSYPENQTVTLWGPATSFESINGNEPLVTVGGYQATGNLAGLTDIPLPTFIEATGQIKDMNGVLIFNIETWQVNNNADWEAGDIRREGDQVIFTNAKGLKLILPDAPADLPLPFENAFVRGIIRYDTFDWKYIDDHLQSNKSQGGGGLISQFHKLNLSGTTVPFTTRTPDQDNPVTEGQTNYWGQTGTIEKAELAYFLKNPYVDVPEWASSEHIYIQPVWRFYGHFSGGDEFEVFVRALEDDFLYPELDIDAP